MGYKQHSKQAFDVEKHREKLLSDVVKVEKEVKQIKETKKREKNKRIKERKWKDMENLVKCLIFMN